MDTETAEVVSGDQEVNGNLVVTGDLLIVGDLTVMGTTTFLNTETYTRREYRTNFISRDASILERIVFLFNPKFKGFKVGEEESYGKPESVA